MSKNKKKKKGCQNLSQDQKLANVLAYAQLKARQKRMGEVEVELYFTGMGLALHELYGFGQQRVARVWQRTDEIITELRDNGGRFESLEEMKKLLKDQIDLECSFR